MTQRVTHGEREVEIDISTPDVTPMLEALTGGGLTVWALWSVPGVSGVRLAVVDKPALGVAYGPQLMAIDADDATRVLHESPRLADDDFVRPTFFQFADRTLLIADHGSEDAYGSLVWSIDARGVQDLDELHVALPEEGDVFTRGIASTARVALTDGRYVITIPGPVLLNPRNEDERLIAREGEVVTFRESVGRFELVQR